MGGHLDVLRWARDHGCRWDKWTCYHAAAGGHMAVLRWAREHYCPWDEWTCSAAAAGRGLHSFTSQLNLSVFNGIRGARRGCVALVK
jgi:hypothetical protein